MTPVVATVNELLRIYVTGPPRSQAVGLVKEGCLEWCSTPQLAERIRACSLGLQSLGVRPGDRVALLSENRWEWLVADFAILAAGAVNVPLHPGLGGRSIGYILRDSGARKAFVSTPALTAQLLEGAGEAEGLDTVISFDAVPGRQAPVMGLAHLMGLGRRHGESHPGRYRMVRDAVGPGSLASLIYTSGTTGNPKGVMLTHGNIAGNISASCSVFDFRQSDVALSFLPLCHIFERTVDYCYLHSGCRVVHLPELKHLAEALPLVRPTVFAAVPRVYEKIHARILRRVPEHRRPLFDWAMKVGLQAVRRQQRHAGVGPWLALQTAIADRLVYRKIRSGLGGRVRFSLSGGAPLAPEIAAFFMAVGLEVLEGYGLTESSPVITTNRVGQAHLGTVGPPLPGVQVRIASDGEILARGPNIMKGYWKDAQRTRETIDSDGWLATGDIGLMGADGYLRITD
ncbi:MAG: AMP-dependent synthetase/ligase, partial [Acidobacteriota bacterium]